MFFKVFVFFALVAAAFASPKPDPQLLAYAAPAVPGVGYSAYSGYAPVAYSSPYGAAAYPYAYTASGYYLR